MYTNLIKQKKISNGAQLLVTYFPTKGAVSFVGSLKAGSRGWVSSELAKVHAAMLLEGTTKHTKKEIQRLLDSMAATLQFSASDERLVFSGRVRTVHLPKLLALVAECLSMPSFPESELAVLQARELSNLTLAAQDTREQAAILLSRTLFKKEHPNYDETTEESKKVLSNITSDFFQSRHKAMVDGRTLVTSIAGDITQAKASSIVEKAFKQLPQTNVIFLPFKKALVSDATKALTTIPNKASIDYMIGATTGITKVSGEYAALLLGTQILGNRGGFSGRLMKTVREEEGLTYGIYAMLAGFDSTTDGYLYIWATFAPALFEKGRASTAKQINKIITEGVTEEEVRKHQELYDSRFKVQLSNSAAFAQAAHSTVVDGMPLSYLDKFPKKVLKLTTSQVNKALKKYLLTKKLSEAAAGPITKI